MSSSSSSSSSNNTQSSNNNNNNNNKRPPLFNIIETSTTVLQKQTEKECSSYFIDLSKLPLQDKKHLQTIGLLSSSSSSSSNKDENEDEDEDEQETETQLQVPLQVQLLKNKHRKYLEQVWKYPLKAPFVSLDSSRPWMLYWCLNGYDLMSSSTTTATTTTPTGNSNSNSNSNSDVDGGSSRDNKNKTHWITNEEGSNMCTTLEDCWQGYYVTDIPDIVSGNDDDNNNEFYFTFHEDDENRNTFYDDEGKKMLPSSHSHSSSPPKYYCGGFGGGPGQMAHAATTYAAILSLCILATCNPDSSDSSSDDKSSNDNNDNIDYNNMHYSIRAKKILKEIRIPLYRWMCSLQVSTTQSCGSGGGGGGGGYRMAHDSEIDVRATYTVVCCAQLLDLLKIKKKKTSNTNTVNNNNTVLGRQEVINYVVSCQTYEGGFGSEPYTEAHGGYTFCGIAALKILGMGSNGTTNNLNININTLTGWLSRRQTTYEGGFSGRTNKLVDGCYSFWQGSAIAIVSSMVNDNDNDYDINANDDGEGDNEDPWLKRYYQNQQQKQNTTSTDNDNDNDNDDDDDDDVAINNNNNNAPPLSYPLLYNIAKLERYILLCAQEPTGGLRDKPSKSRDFYHTCYNLCGLSIAQQHTQDVNNNKDDDDDDDENENENESTFGDQKQTLLEYTHPVYNIRIDRVAEILNINWE